MSRGSGRETDESVLGSCPNCAATLPAARLLIRYERDGRSAEFAECPDCLDVVHPQ